MKKELSKLLRLPDIETALCGLLMSKGLVKSGDLKYNSLTLTEAGKQAIKQTTVVDPEFIKQYRELFPPGKWSTAEEVSDKMAILLEEGHDEMDILEATRHYLSQVRDVTYCEKAGYLISKKVDGTTRSTLREYLERLKLGV